MKREITAEAEALRIFKQYYNAMGEPVVYFMNVQMRYDAALECALMSVADILVAGLRDERIEFYKDVENELKKM